MAIPSLSAVQQTVKTHGVGAVFNTWLAVSSLNQYRDRVHRGQNPIMAALIEGAALAPNFLLSPAALAVTGLGLPLARASASAVIGAVRDHNNFIRQAKTPFSHRFEHSDTTLRAQQLGLQQIGSAWGHARMGSEAGAFAARYGRG